jgi:hypothetical protein
MRNLLAFLAAAVLTFLAVGWYLNWYQVKATPGPAGHEDVRIDLDGTKISADVKEGEKELMDAIKKAEEERAAKEAAKAAAGDKDGPVKKDKEGEKSADFSKPGGAH